MKHWMTLIVFAALVAPVAMGQFDDGFSATGNVLPLAERLPAETGWLNPDPLLTKGSYPSCWPGDPLCGDEMTLEDFKAWMERAEECMKWHGDRWTCLDLTSPKDPASPIAPVTKSRWVGSYVWPHTWESPAWEHIPAPDGRTMRFTIVVGENAG